MANYCFVAPLLPGGLDLMKAWKRDHIQGSKEHDAVFKAAGISREQVWLQHSPMGDLAVVSFEVKDVGKAMQHLAMAKDPWAAQFRAFLKKGHGVDLAKPMPPNEQIVDWKA